MAGNFCVLGDSHVACIKVAWDRNFSKRADCSLTFFASPGSGMENLYVQDGALLPKGPLKEHLIQTSGGRDRIELNKYDGCLICGLTFRFPHLPPVGKFYSSSLKAQLCRDVFFASRARALLGKIRTVSKVPVWVVHVPLVASAADQPPACCIDYDMFIDMVRGELASIDAVLLRQPVATIVNDCYTHERFAKNSCRLLKADLEFPEADVRHMNEAFGTLFLESFLAEIGCLPGQVGTV